ncbi:MAG: hypothetical protein AAFP87_20520 [Pseudomonadota bacterium]
MADQQQTPQQKAAATRAQKKARQAAAKQAAAYETAHPGATPPKALQEALKAGALDLKAAGDAAMGTLPLAALILGGHARRKCWAKGISIFVADNGGRGGNQPTIMITGSRAGALPYVRQMSDDVDLLADDWEVIEV